MILGLLQHNQQLEKQVKDLESERDGYKKEFEKYLNAFHVELQQKNELISKLTEARSVIIEFIDDSKLGNADALIKRARAYLAQ